jgi:hypothetical protein
MAGDRHGFNVRFDRAVHRGAWCMGSGKFMRLSNLLDASRPPTRHSADNGLTTFVHGDVLNPDRLLASGAMPFQSLQLDSKGTGQFVERVRGAILLRDGFHA